MTFEEYLSSLKGKTVGVIGVGVSMLNWRMFVA